MTENRRIILNFIATYGRSIYALIIGLCCGRWTLMALGQIDYGLMGLIGGLVGCVTFLNGLLSSAIGRFYAISVGAARKLGNELAGLEECRKWFNTALSIHTVLPTILVLIGYPIGHWTINNVLVIPVDRLESCIWVWRFTCISCYVSMFTAPFQAMYSAKQEIAELTVYSFATTTLNVCFLYYMVSHPHTWLLPYVAWTCLLSVIPQALIVLRAIVRYPECKFNAHYLLSIPRYRQLAIFAFARFWSEFSSLFAAQGQALLVNKYMGVRFNTSMAIGNNVASQSLTLAGALDGALWPAITNKIGEGKHQEVHKLCFVTFRVCTLLILIFAIPLALEIHEVLRLWLVNPPIFSAEICIAVMLYAVLERMSGAYGMAIIGYGTHVMKYSWTVGWAGFALVFISWGCFILGFGMWSIVLGLILSKFITIGVRLYYGYSMIRISARDWMSKVFFPMAGLILVTLGVGLLPRLVLRASFFRITVTTVLTEITLLPLSWFFLLDEMERTFILRRLRPAVDHLKACFNKDK